MGYNHRMAYEIHNGDCLDVLKSIADCSIDAIVTDPPYGLSFMGKKWDYDVPGLEIWAECLRVLKPGGHLLAFAGTRTQHRMAVRIEDGGFEIRDMIAWVYGSGFPKSHNLKDEWQGWGTALKPALEPITVARKPLIGTVAENVQAYSTGAINIDGCRVGFASEKDKAAAFPGGKTTSHGAGSLAGPASAQDVSRGGFEAERNSVGRWPANLIHDGSDDVVAVFPRTGPAQGGKHSGRKGTRDDVGEYGFGRVEINRPTDDGGSAARFFYCAKASKKDRDEGLETPEKPFVQFQTGNGASGKPSSLSEGRETAYKNNHPTVKPTELMRYLCRLVTPPGGTVLDPFMGSGSTGKAAILEGFNFIGIEREAEYINIAKARLEAAMNKPSISTSIDDQPDMFG